MCKTIIPLTLILVLACVQTGRCGGNLDKCVSKCKKPASSSVDYSNAATWRKQVTAELAYDTCVLRCEKDEMPGGTVWFNTGFKYPSMAGF